MLNTPRLGRCLCRGPAHGGGSFCSSFGFEPLNHLTKPRPPGMKPGTRAPEPQNRKFMPYPGLLDPER